MEGESKIIYVITNSLSFFRKDPEYIKKRDQKMLLLQQKIAKSSTKRKILKFDQEMDSNDESSDTEGDILRLVIFQNFL